MTDFFDVRGIEVNDETLPVEVIRDVCLDGPGHYLGHEQTLSLMQKEHVYPLLGNRMSPKEWNEAGRPDILERATAKKREILATYHPPHIPKATDDLIRQHHDIKLPREMMEMGDPRWG